VLRVAAVCSAAPAQDGSGKFFGNRITPLPAARLYFCHAEVAGRVVKDAIA
jgi:hypothetical protein